MKPLTKIEDLELHIEALEVLLKEQKKEIATLKETVKDCGFKLLRDQVHYNNLEEDYNALKKELGK